MSQNIKDSVKEIADLFHVPISTIGNIKYNLTWKELL